MNSLAHKQLTSLKTTRPTPHRLLPVVRAVPIDAVNVVVGTVAVSLAVDTLAVFWRRRRSAQKVEVDSVEDDE